MKQNESSITFLEKVTSNTWNAEVLSLVAVIVCLLQSIIYAHILYVSMDEGTYLNKGLLFVKGVYRPFQEYGPWNNKMPLSCYIHGAAQALFGPGLRTGRYFAVFLIALMLVGTWLVIRRLGGRWWAAIILWAVAINPSYFMLYSLATSQGIVACMLVWVFVLILGKQRPLWQTTLGGILASFLIMTRQNMLPVVFFTVGYTFWENGKRAGWHAALVSILTLFISHVIYWPNIMYIWLPWVPNNIRQILFSDWQITLDGTTSTWTTAYGFRTTSYGFLTKMFVFWESVRLYFFPIIGTLTTWILWPKRSMWKSDEKYKIAVVLSGTFIVLTAAHMWASMGENYCLFCFSGYLAFFIQIGWLLVVVSYSSWVRSPGFWRQMLVYLFIVVCTTGMGLGAYQELDDIFLNIQVPRMKNMRILSGMTELWRLLSNKFGWSYEMLQQLLPAVAGMLVGVVILIIAVLYFAVICKKKPSINLGYTAIIWFFIIGIVFSPTHMMGGGKYQDICGWDIISSHEAVGAYLEKIVPAGSLVFWQNDISPVPLLYMTDITIFPAQLDHWYNCFEGGDPEQLLKWGYWNNRLSRQWMQEADYLLIAERYVLSFYNNEYLEGEYDEREPSPSTVPCQDRSLIHIFRRIR